MKLNTSVSKLLTNKWVLNILSLIALLNVIGYMVMGNINIVLLFIVLALLVRYFSKNMIIVLGIPLIIANLLALHHVMMKKVENMDNMSKNNENNSKNNKNNNEKNTNTNKKTDLEHKEIINKINKQNAKTKQGLPITPLEHENISSSTTDESFEVGRAKRGGGYDIDYASTIEDAYDELNKILGSDGIKRLTDDTQGLMKQQMQLAEAMKGMAPIIQGMAPMMKQAQDLLGGMGDNKEGLGNILEMAKKFTGKQ